MASPHQTLWRSFMIAPHWTQTVDNGEITSKPARVKRAADSSPIMKAESAADSCNQRYNQMASRFVYHFNIIMQTLMNRTYDLQLIYSFSQEREKCIYHKLFEVGGKRFTIRLPFFIFDTSHSGLQASWLETGTRLVQTRKCDGLFSLE